MDKATTSRLKPEWRAVGASHPREAWRQRPKDSLATTWLAMHDSLRAGQAYAERIATHWQLKLLPLAGFHEQIVAVLRNHLGHLHGHHRLEDSHYFPQFRTLQPLLSDAFDMLEDDHGTLDELLKQLERVTAEFAGTDASSPAAHELATTLVGLLYRIGPLLRRHLDDEEDIVIPLLAEVA